jgi:hypothetical protein
MAFLTFSLSELIGDMVTQKLQQPPLSMVKAPVPFSITSSSLEPHCNILMTPDALTTPDKLLILIPGSQTPLGQWSRRVMCDNNVNEGSMVATSLKALEQGYQIIIANPNANYWSDGQSLVKLLASPAARFSSSLSHDPFPRSKELDQNVCLFQKVILQRVTSVTSLNTMSNLQPLPKLSSWARVGPAT